VYFWLASGHAPTRRLRALAACLAVAAALAYPNLGFFHVRDRSPIHWHETFHYFMGAKYLPELGYTRLYDATWVAGRELGAVAQIRQVRDLATYALRDVASIDAGSVRARFSAARWQAFKRDLLVFGRQHHPVDARGLPGGVGHVMQQRSPRGDFRDVLSWNPFRPAAICYGATFFRTSANRSVSLKS